MKIQNRVITALCMGVFFIGFGSGQCLAAKPAKDASILHRDGTAFIKEKRITQAERQAAADRAKAKGFKAPKVGGGANSEKANQADKGAKL